MSIPEEGDIAWIDFEPTIGTEQSGRRPAIVLTDSGYNLRYSRSIVCPITSNATPWPTKVLLPPEMKTIGGVLVDQVRTVEREKRGFRLIERAPMHILLEVRTVLAVLMKLRVQ